MYALKRRIRGRLRGRRERLERAPAANVIVSFPKSGRTWLRVMLGRALCDTYGLPEERLLDTPHLMRSAGLPTTVFSHDGSSNTEARHLRNLSADKREYESKRVLFLRRDPRDVVVSCYFQANRRRDLFRGTLAQFVRDPRYGIEKVLRFYQVWHAGRGVPSAFRLTSYERMHEDPAKVLRDTLEFLGVPAPSDESVSRAVEFARFENMRSMEEDRRFESRRMLPGREGDEESYKVRRGQIGGFRDYLSPDDAAFCDRAMSESACALLELDTG